MVKDASSGFGRGASTRQGVPHSPNPEADCKSGLRDLER